MEDCWENFRQLFSIKYIPNYAFVCKICSQLSGCFWPLWVNYMMSVSWSLVNSKNALLLSMCKRGGDLHGRSMKNKKTAFLFDLWCVMWRIILFNPMWTLLTGVHIFTNVFFSTDIGGYDGASVNAEKKELFFLHRFSKNSRKEIYFFSPPFFHFQKQQKK